MSQENAEEFLRYWKDTEDALRYCVNTRKNKGKIITTRYMEELVEEEIKQKRWFSKEVVHPAAAWLNLYTKEHPKEGNELRKLLEQINMNLGVNLLVLILQILSWIILSIPVILVFHKFPGLVLAFFMIAVALIVFSICITLSKQNIIVEDLSKQMKQFQIKCTDIINGAK